MGAVETLTTLPSLAELSRSQRPSIAVNLVGWVGRSRNPPMQMLINGGLREPTPHVLQTCVSAQGSGFIGCLPGELRLFATEVAVGSGLLVDRTQQIQHLHHALR